MFFDVTNQNFCEDCGRDLNSKYNNMKRAKLRLSNQEYTNLKDEMTVKSLEESWVSVIDPPPNAQMEESCLFMVNFNKNCDTMVTSSVNIIDVWDFSTKKIRKSLPDHVEIVTGMDWFKSTEEDMFVSCSLDKTMKIWKDYTCVHTLTHHADWLRCVSISRDNQYLISGCVSSVVWGYDLHKQQPTFSIVNKDGKATLNTINSVDFQQNSRVFLSGTRDGYIKLYDIRADPSKPIQQIFSHKMKLNSAVFGSNDNIILSGGRDSAARLWDLRMTRAMEEARVAPSNNQSVREYVAEYTGHVNKGYNIATQFFNADKYVITGSEDGYIYIYNTHTAKLVRKIPAGTKIIHLLKPFPDPNVGFAYSGLQKNTIHFYDAKTTEDQMPKKDIHVGEEIAPDPSEPSLKIIEEFMAENGDLILKVFHSNNITYSSGMSWDNLLKLIIRQADADSRRLYTRLNEVLLRNMQQLMQVPQHTLAKETKNPSEPQEKKKKPIYRSIHEKSIGCEKCREKQRINVLDSDSLDQNCDLIRNLP